MHHEVAVSDLGGLGDELVGALLLARRPADALAQQILFGGQHQLVGNETPLQAQRHQPDHAARQRLQGREGVGGLGAQAVFAQQVAEPLPRTAAPGGDHEPPALAHPAVGLRAELVEHVGAEAVAEHRRRASAAVNAGQALGLAER